MATINKTMKTLSVADGQDTIKYEIVDEAGRNNLAQSILVQDTQPESPANKIWVKETPGEEVQVATLGEFNDLKSVILLQEETIPDTTQTISSDSSGNVSSIIHKDGSNNAIRSDAFTFGTNTITEVRTLYTGETLTIVTNTITLVTTVTYAAA